MPPDHEYYVYILASRSRTLYIGVTNNLRRRVREHRDGTANSFTAKYKINRLVYFERFQHIDKAITREKYLKHFTREEKITLIESTNPTWEDLAAAPLPIPLTQTPYPKNLVILPRSGEDLLFPRTAYHPAFATPCSPCHPSATRETCFCRCLCTCRCCCI